jgi:hypothetical protein
VVETPDQLEQVLRSDFVGCVVVAKDKFLNMTGSIPINSGVWLQGERGELGSRPSLFTDAKCADPSASPPESEACRRYSLFQITGNNISVTGLHLRGPAMGSRSINQPQDRACTKSPLVILLGNRQSDCAGRRENSHAGTGAKV